MKEKKKEMGEVFQKRQSEVKHGITKYKLTESYILARYKQKNREQKNNKVTQHNLQMPNKKTKMIYFETVGKRYRRYTAL